MNHNLATPLLALLLLVVPSLAYASEGPGSEDQKPLQKLINKMARVVKFELKMFSLGLQGEVAAKIQPKYQAGKWGPATLAFHRDIPVLRVYGTARQMGLQQGHLLRKQIHLLMDHYLSKFMGTITEQKKALVVAKKLEKYIPQRFIEEMKGLAQGAKISYNKILLAQTFLDIYRIPACSTVGIQPDRTDVGPIFGRNLDFPSLGVAHHFSLVTVFHPKGKSPFAAVTWPGFAGVLTGLNQRGLSLGVMVIQYRKFRDKGFPMILLYRHILEEASTLDEAVKIIRKSTLTVTNNLMIADTKGICVAELMPGNPKIRRPKSDFICSTNHFQSPGLAQFIPSMVYYSSYKREKILRQSYDKAPKKITPEYVQEMLQATAIKRINIQSMVILPKKRTIYLAVGSDFAAVNAPFVKFDRQVLFGKKKKK